MTPVPPLGTLAGAAAIFALLLPGISPTVTAQLKEPASPQIQAAPTPAPAAAEAAEPAAAAAPTSLALKAGSTISAPLAVAGVDAAARVTVVTSGLPSARSVYTRVQLRKSGSTFYTAQLRSTTGGKARLEIQRVVSGKITVLSAKDVPLADPSVARVLAFKVAGSSFEATVWEAKATRPSSPTLKVSDTTAQAITSGTGAGISAYLQSGTQGTVTQTLSDATADSGAVVTPPVEPVPPVNDDAYKAGWGTPVFRDEFSTDLSRWSVRNNSTLSYDWAVIKAANINVSGGNANLITQRMASAQNIDGHTRWYSSAYMNSKSEQAQAYGRWEVRAKLPTIKGKSKGIWPAFWMRPVDGGNGEIDILEAYGTPTTKNFDVATKSEVTVHFESSNVGHPYKLGSFTPDGIDVNDGQFHKWAVEWTPAAITYFVDDKQFFQVKRTDDARYDKVFGAGRKFDMRLNVQVGSNYWGEPNTTDTADRTQFLVDYVRVWKYTGK